MRALDACGNVEPLRWTVEIDQEPPPDPCTSDATPPSLTFASPSPGTSTSGPVELAATASDTNGVTRVDFHIDGLLLLSDSNAPYATTWDPSTSPSGSYVLEARATDTCGNTTSRFVTVSVAHPPFGWLDTPRHNQVMSGWAAPITRWALGDGGLDSLWMSIDGQLPLTHIGSFNRGANRPGACNTYPYIVDPDCPQVGITGSFDTTGLTNGVHALRMSMTADNGLSNVFTRTFRVDNPAPRGWIHVPGHNQTLAGTGVIVYGWALGAGGLDNLSVTVDGTPIAITFHLSWAGACAANPDMPDPDCPLVGWSGTLDTTTFADGPHTMTLTGQDASGRWLSFERSFVVENP
ncbi:MAG: Ig-like domain-containing protein [Acidobacteriota bacterium]